jgi:hypothetical protein
VMSKAKAIVAGVRSEGAIVRARIAHNKVVTAEAHVPGPGFRYPMPKNVPSDFAQTGVC